MKNEKLFINIAIFLGIYFLIANPILKKLGVKKSNTDKELDTMYSSPQSPFSPDYWRNNLYQAGTAANGRKPVTEEMLKRLRLAANYFYGAFGIFTDDENEVFKAIQMCKTQTEVSLMSFLISANYSNDMLSLMKYGKNVMPQNGLNESEINNVIKMVKSKKIS